MLVNTISPDMLKLLSAIDLFKTKGGQLANSEKFSNDQTFPASFVAGQQVDITVEKVRGFVSVGQNNKAGIATGVNALKAVVEIKIGEKQGIGQIFVHDLAVAVRNGGKYSATVQKGTYEKASGEKDADNKPTMTTMQWVAFSATDSLTNDEIKEQLAKVAEFSTAFEGVI